MPDVPPPRLQRSHRGGGPASRTVPGVQIRGLDHLVLTVVDPEATVAFYERLGMRREVFDNGRLALRFGVQKINLHRAGAPIQPHAIRPTPGSADICLLVEGRLDDVERELERAGVVFELGPVARTGATTPIRSLYLRDPDGNLVELSEPI
jgi:catechol 2,3-dioxygenase-like lactoylglutathione lyase family enzyme